MVVARSVLLLVPIPRSWPVESGVQSGVESGVVALRTLMDSRNDVFMYNCCVTVFSDFSKTIEDIVGHKMQTTSSECSHLKNNN